MVAYLRASGTGTGTSAGAETETRTAPGAQLSRRKKGRMFDWLKKGIPAPDPGWMPFVKIGFGFWILVVLAALAAIIALGKVHAESSFGLDIILGGLLTLAGGFSGWAFGNAPHPGSPAEPAETAQTGEKAPPLFRPNA